MKRYFIFMAIVLGMIAPSISAQTAKQKVAVYVTGDIENGYKKFIGSKLTTGITRSENYIAVERTADFLAELTKEQDYQMSGAVSDNQIARLGQQFGVQYVLVADISEVFESMFISARMIDVQTAQITNSTESDAVVNNMESLTKITENIVLRLFYAKYEIKVLGPFSTIKDLAECKVPDNYHIATQDEMVRIIKNYQILNKKIYLPVYTDISTEYIFKTQYYTISYERLSGDTVDRPYSQVQCYYTFIKDVDSISTLHSSYNLDDGFNSAFNVQNSNGFSTRGMYDMSTNHSITPGYVYVIKTKEKDE